MDKIFWFVVSSLSVYRVSRMISMQSEDGPFEIFSKWRNFVGQETWIGRGFHCIYCVGFWAGCAAAWYSVFMGMFSKKWFIILWPAYNAVTILMHNWTLKE